MKKISLILVLAMCLSLFPQVYAAPLTFETVESAAERIDELSDVTSDSQQTALMSEDETYMLNVLVFALKKTASLNDVSDTLVSLGITNVTPLFTENGKAAPLGENGDIWYRAFTENEVYAACETLAALDGVAYAEPEYVYHSDNYGEPTEVERITGWVYDALLKRKSDFWWHTIFNHDYAPGKGTVIAVIDTGVDYTHEDLTSNMWVNMAELDGTPGVDDDGDGYIDDIYGVDVTAYGTKKAGNPMDDNGHGTHVAGIIGMSSNGKGGIGLACGAKIMAIKAGQSTGTFASSDIARAIRYAHMMGADVINMSFGGTMQSYLVENALKDAFTDCVLVASAGNNGLPTTDADPDYYPKSEDIYPAAYPYVIGVMATDSLGKLASFSNWDYNPGINAEYEMTAPGVNVYSTLPGNRYAKWNGTSMAAPCVAAAAAIIRSHYTDKDMYSSRFIMGQLVSATKDRTIVSKLTGSYAYPALDIYDSIEYLPNPNISVKQVFAMDNVREDNELNDGDSIIDVGETIDLGILIRNQWGLTGDITVKADALSIAGVPNPYIEFITDTITLEPAGTFGESNNGFVYDDGLLTSVSNPIQFKVAPETPNDTEICINLHVTTTNGVDSKDKTTYTAETAYTFRVQAGRSLKGTISEDMTLTKDYLWIVENTVYIPEGVTLTVEPGTRIQFYSSDYEDAYGGKTIANIDCDGTLNAIGTEDEPIEMFLGKGFERLAVEIAGDGAETLKYCKITNPRLGYIGYYDIKPIYLIDHCTLVQNNEYNYRYLSSLFVDESAIYGFFAIENIRNSLFSKFDRTYSSVTIQTDKIESCLLESSVIEVVPMRNYLGMLRTNHNNVYVVGTKKSLSRSSIACFNDFTSTFPTITNYEIVSSDETIGSTYACMTFETKQDRSSRKLEYDYARALAQSLGGDLLQIDNDMEKDYIFQQNLTGIIGAKFSSGQNKYVWENGSSCYLDSLKYIDAFVSIKRNTLVSENINRCYILELPLETTNEDILEKIEKINFSEFVKNYKTFTNNAILNPVYNQNPQTWSLVQARAFNNNLLPNYALNNYWGTENKTLINKMIIDADDFPGTYQDIIEDPILTLESESLAEIYPFVTKIYLEDTDGNIVSTVTPGQTVTVHVLFNRDMASDIAPLVTYGPDTPYTDYRVHGDFTSAREWVGTTTISPVLTGGTMYFRTNGGAAADDKWLVCGEDTLRFCFNISTNGVLAMMLNASGGANKVELSWAQNDYDVLAGYNLYRSESADKNFKKINSSILAETSYTDTDVKPGVLYYYYFKVVDTDGNEQDAISNTASAAPIDNIFPVLTHSPVKKAKNGTQITISATATDNIGVTAVKLYYRKAGDTEFTLKNVTESATKDLYVAVIPAAAVTGAGVEYYITAEDADGNVSYNGTQQIPNVIRVNTTPYISGITPSKAAIAGGSTVSILGGNFSEDMIVKVGEKTVAEVSFIDAGQINFIAPEMPCGSYAVTLVSKDGTSTVSPVALGYIDSSSTAQIPTEMILVSGIEYTIPFYVTSASEIISLHAELDLPNADFMGVKVEKADPDAGFSLEYTYSGGVLKIGCISSSGMNADKALLNIKVTPRVTENKQYTLNLHDVAFNGVAVNTVISGMAFIKPSFLLKTTVKYFTGDKAISDVIVTADGVAGVTDETGSASLTLAQKDVTVSVSRSTAAVGAVTAYDASLVLQSAVGTLNLTDAQKLAADVDGNGRIDEYDAALILQKSVRKINVFPIGKTWVFVPAYAEKTLTTGENTLTFTAVAIGDVDGSFQGDAQ